MRTKPCDAATRAGRAKKARAFLDAAALVATFDDEGDLVDAHITLCVHAGIAAADAICCAALGEHAQGQDHAEAVGLLMKVDEDLAKDLGRLLKLKTRAGYGAQTTPSASQKAADRAAERLVAAIPPSSS